MRNTKRSKQLYYAIQHLVEKRLAQGYTSEDANVLTEEEICAEMDCCHGKFILARKELVSSGALLVTHDKKRRTHYTLKELAPSKFEQICQAHQSA